MAKEYIGEAITVEWRPERCIHTARCLRALPEVFDTQRRPWVDAGAAEAAAIAAAVDQCPSGALRYRLTGGEDDGSRAGDGAAAAAATVAPFPNGPLVIRGPVEIRDASGTVLAVEDRVTLCRCGATGNAPFCDNSHRSVGFQDGVPMVAPPRREADSPAACGPQQEG